MRTLSLGKICRYRWKFQKTFVLQWVFGGGETTDQLLSVGISDAKAKLSGNFWNFMITNYHNFIINKFKFYFKNFDYDCYMGRPISKKSDQVDGNIRRPVAEKAEDVAAPPTGPIKKVVGLKELDFDNYIWTHDALDKDSQRSILVYHAPDNDLSIPSLSTLNNENIRRVRMRPGLMFKRFIYPKCKNSINVFETKDYWNNRTLFKTLGECNASNAGAVFFNQWFGPCIKQDFIPAGGERPFVYSLQFDAYFYVYGTFSKRHYFVKE